ncbi:MAG: hypothetical protein P1U42_01145 [Phycisphaerales bacterium]|nr:hypothetical protein [Phycisphaerales bacterium]
MSDKEQPRLAPAMEISNFITQALSTSGKADEIAMDIAFHMTDWYEDLQELIRFYQNPSEYSAEQIDDLLMDFLIHAPHHLAAAKVLHTCAPVRDVFEIGAVE